MGSRASAPGTTDYCVSPCALELFSCDAYYIGVINRFGRVLVALTAAVALQGSLLGGGAVCAVSGHHSADPDVSARLAMSGMMPAAALPAEYGSSADVAPRADAVAPAGTGTEAPCGHQDMPRECAVMAACVVFAQSAPVSLDESADAQARGVFWIAEAPRSATRLPELPPPRAS